MSTTNRFFSYIANALPFKTARAGDIAVNGEATQLAFDNVQKELDRCLRFPLTDPVLAVLPTAGARAGKGLSFDANGLPVMVNIASDQAMADAAAAAASALVSAAQVTAAASAMLSVIQRITTATHSLESGKDHLITFAGQVTMIWPVSPADGDMLRITVANGRSDNKISAGLDSVMGVVEDYIFNVPGVTRTFKHYTGLGWRII